MLKQLLGEGRVIRKWQEHDAEGCNTNSDAESYLFQDVSCREKNSGPGILRTLWGCSIGSATLKAVTVSSQQHPLSKTFLI